MYACVVPILFILKFGYQIREIFYSKAISKGTQNLPGGPEQTQTHTPTQTNTHSLTLQISNLSARLTFAGAKYLFLKSIW